MCKIEAAFHQFYACSFRIQNRFFGRILKCCMCMRVKKGCSKQMEKKKMKKWKGKNKKTNFNRKNICVFKRKCFASFFLQDIWIIIIILNRMIINWPIHISSMLDVIFVSILMLKHLLFPSKIAIIDNIFHAFIYSFFFNNSQYNKIME